MLVCLANAFERVMRTIFLKISKVNSIVEFWTRIEDVKYLREMQYKYGAIQLNLSGWAPGKILFPQIELQHPVNWQDIDRQAAFPKSNA